MDPGEVPRGDWNSPLAPFAQLSSAGPLFFSGAHRSSVYVVFRYWKGWSTSSCVVTTEWGPPRSLKLNFWPSTRILSQCSIAAAGVASSRRYSRPAADCAAGVVVDGQRMAMVGMWAARRKG